MGHARIWQRGPGRGGGRGRTGAPAPDWGPAAFAAQTRPPVGASNSGPRRAAREQAAVTPSGPAGPPTGPAPPPRPGPRGRLWVRGDGIGGSTRQKSSSASSVQSRPRSRPGQVQDHQRRQNLGVRRLLGASPRLRRTKERARACRHLRPARVAGLPNCPDPPFSRGKFQVCRWFGLFKHEVGSGERANGSICRVCGSLNDGGNK